ncbi:MAG: hypothetical protein ABIK92_20250 [Pseudomonadota bacterium]
MRLVRIMIITVILGLSIGFLPKTGMARDVSMGIHLGIPFPVIEVYHALPFPPHPRAFYSHRPYNRNTFANRSRFRHNRNNEYRGEGHGYYNREERRDRYDRHDGYRNSKPRRR